MSSWISREIGLFKEFTTLVVVFRNCWCWLRLLGFGPIGVLQNAWIVMSRAFTRAMEESLSNIFEPRIKLLFHRYVKGDRYSFL
jgi:hypothetical protein